MLPKMRLFESCRYVTNNSLAHHAKHTMLDTAPCLCHTVFTLQKLNLAARAAATMAGAFFIVCPHPIKINYKAYA